MTGTAFQTQYRDEFIQGFEQRQSLLRGTVTSEANIKGNQAVFLVADSGGATAVTRGPNGLIPSRDDNLAQNTATITEWHDLVRKNRFNILAGQSDQRAIMQDTTMAVINRKVDNQIIVELTTATLTTGAATTGSLSLAMKALTILGNNDVPYDGRVYAVITPAFYAYLLQTKEFASADYVGGKPFEDGYDFMMPVKFWWANIMWCVHPNLAGKGTASETCFMYHSTAIGHAAAIEEMDSKVGYEEEQDYSWARATIFMGAKKLQNSGIVKMIHDGSEYA
jgi:hypothetical protein